MENIQWKVDGMSCTNCALSIHKYLSSKGIHEPKVNFMEGEVQFELVDAAQKPALIKGIQDLGYKVRGQEAEEGQTKKWLDNNKERAIFSMIFTLPLIVHMIPGVHIHWLMNPYVQLALTIPVFIVGMNYFGKSAINSLFNGIPNMNITSNTIRTYNRLYELNRFGWMCKSFFINCFNFPFFKSNY